MQSRDLEKILDMHILMCGFIHIPTGHSPGPEYVSYSSCQIKSNGSVGSYGTVVGDSYGRKYFITLRLPTQLETVCFMLKLMEEVI